MVFFGVPIALDRGTDPGDPTRPYDIPAPLASGGIGTVYREVPMPVSFPKNLAEQAQVQASADEGLSDAAVLSGEVTGYVHGCAKLEIFLQPFHATEPGAKCVGLNC